MSSTKCPRCGEPISWITKKKRGNRYYYYAVHYHGIKGGKRVEEYCYLGPTDKYVYAETINPLGLTNAIEADRFIEYLHRVIDNYLGDSGDDKSFDVVKALNILDEVINLLKEKVRNKEDKKKIAERLKVWLEELEKSK